MPRTTLTARMDALEATLDRVVAAVETLAQAQAPAKSTPARGKAKSDVVPFPQALAQSRTRKCVAAKHWSVVNGVAVHRGKRADGMFTPNGATFHADNGGVFEA